MKTEPGGRGTVIEPPLPKPGSGLPLARKRTILVAPATTMSPPGVCAISRCPGVNSKGSAYLMPTLPPFSAGKAIAVLPLLPKLLSRSPAAAVFAAARRLAPARHRCRGEACQQQRRPPDLILPPSAAHADLSPYRSLACQRNNPRAPRK